MYLFGPWAIAEDLDRLPVHFKIEVGNVDFSEIYATFDYQNGGWEYDQNGQDFIPIPKTGVSPTYYPPSGNSQAQLKCFEYFYDQVYWRLYQGHFLGTSIEYGTPTGILGPVSWQAETETNIIFTPQGGDIVYIGANTGGTMTPYPEEGLIRYIVRTDIKTAGPRYLRDYIIQLGRDLKVESVQVSKIARSVGARLYERGHKGDLYVDSVKYPGLVPLKVNLSSEVLTPTGWAEFTVEFLGSV